MSKKDDLLGLLIDTSLQPVDDDPGFDAYGHGNVLSPEGADASEETEDDAAYAGMIDEGASPLEAQEEVDFMRPLDDEEAEILRDNPELARLTKVDDAEHQAWLIDKASQGYKGMDRVLEDASYGDTNMSIEEQMELAGSDDESGWSIRKGLRKIKRGVKKGAGSAYKGVRKGARGVKKGIKKGAKGAYKGIKKYNPAALAARAALIPIKKLVKKFTSKMVSRRVALLAKQRGLSKPGPAEKKEALAWSKQEVRRRQPKFGKAIASLMGNDRTSLVASMMGLESDAMGFAVGPAAALIALGPFGLAAMLSAILLETKKSGAAPAPEKGSPEAEAEAMKIQEIETAPEEAPEGYAPSEDQDETYESEGDDMNGELVGIDGEDSLGSYAAQILGTSQPAKDNPHVDNIVNLMVFKLKNGKQISPSELGLLSSAASEGNSRAQKVLTYLNKQGAVVSGDSSGLDPWLYKLNPSYWLASSRKKSMIDVEKKKWKENHELNKKLAKQREDLEAAERAMHASQTVEAARAQAAATDAQLAAIADSLRGEMSGSFVGHEKPTKIADVVMTALEKTGNKEAASRLYNKITAGQVLAGQDLNQAKKIARIVGRLKVVHGDLKGISELSGAFIGACVLGQLKVAASRNDKDGKIADTMAKKIASGQPLSVGERKLLSAVLKHQAALHQFTTSLVSGRAFVGSDKQKTLTRGAFVGAVKVMSEADKKMLSSIVKLAKLGNPRAVKALAALKKSGEISGGDVLGLSLSQAFLYANAPVWAPAYGAYKAAKWIGKKTGILKKGGKASPQSVRLAKLRAAAKRRQAAAARAAAADAESAAEQRTQQALAYAADAEADAADAESLKQEMAMRTAEVEANPDSANEIYDDSEGAFIGSWTSVIGKGTRAKKIIDKAAEKSPTGDKVRAGAKVYKAARSGNPKAKKAVKTIVVKAKKGDPQAVKDLNALKAGRAAVLIKEKAQKKAQKKQVVAKKRAARKEKVISVQRKFENRAGDALARASRKNELKKLAKIERKAAAGNPKAKKFVAKKVAAAKKGDPKAKAQVNAMKLSRTVRKACKSPAERKRMKEAEKMVNRLNKNDPKAWRQYRMLQDAAAKGNPNAKRALARISLASVVVKVVNKGVVQPTVASKKVDGPGVAKAPASPPVPGTPDWNKLKQQIADAKKKAGMGTVTREEAAAGSRAAEKLGDDKSASELAQVASKAPSATEELKKTGALVNAAEKGSPEAKAEIQKSLEGAKAGNVADIKKTADVIAVNTVADAAAGKPISPIMTEAINMQERIKAGDPVAIDTAKKVAEAATAPNPTATAVVAATALAAATVMDKSLAAKPAAKKELMEKVNPPLAPEAKSAADAELAVLMTKANDGTITPEEGERGVALASATNQPRKAAEIAAKAPPVDYSTFTAMSTLPDQPLAPITGLVGLLKASLQAFTFTTPDPLANYREGVTVRSKDTKTTAMVPVSSSGWSPFKFFAAAKAIAPFTPFAAPMAAEAAFQSASKKGKKEQTPAEAALSATAGSDPKAPRAAKELSSSEFKTAIAKAIQTKKMTKAEFNKALDGHVDPKTNKLTRLAAAEKMLSFLSNKDVKIS